MAKKRHPKPSVEFGRQGDDINEAKMRGMICNPIYAGLGPFPAIIDEETWVKSAAEMIKKEGAEQFLVNMLYVLRQTFDEED